MNDNFETFWNFFLPRGLDKVPSSSVLDFLQCFDSERPIVDKYGPYMTKLQAKSLWDNCNSYLTPETAQMKEWQLFGVVGDGTLHLEWWVEFISATPPDLLPWGQRNYSGIIDTSNTHVTIQDIQRSMITGALKYVPKNKYICFQAKTLEIEIPQPSNTFDTIEDPSERALLGLSSTLVTFQ